MNKQGGCRNRKSVKNSTHKNFNWRNSTKNAKYLNLRQSSVNWKLQLSVISGSHNQLNGLIVVENQLIYMYIYLLGGFLFWWKLEFQLLHGFKFFHFVHWFRNSFCFCSQMIFYVVCNFLRFKGNLHWDELEWPKNHFRVVNQSIKL